MKRLSLILVIILMVCVSSLSGAERREIEAASRVDAVTVFNGHANVTRVYEGTFDPGRYRLKLTGLPTDIDDDSVRVAGKGTAKALILNVKIKKEEYNLADEKTIQRLESKLTDLRRRRAELDDRLNILKEREKTLAKLTENTADAVRKKETPTPSLKEWASMMDFQEKQLVSIHAKRRDLESNIARLKEQEEKLSSEIAYHRADTEVEGKTVYVDLDVTAGGRLTISAAYMVEEVCWTPSYDLYIDGPGRDARLVCSAMVKQESEEDWEKVNLTLSTAKPREFKEVPTLSPMTLVRGQATGAIHGQVVLEDGSEIPGTYIVVTSPDTKIKRTDVTDEHGRFTIRRLPPGLYFLEAHLEGFKTVKLKDFRVFSGKTSDFYIMMETGAIQKEIVVSAFEPINLREADDVIDISGNSTEKVKPYYYWEKKDEDEEGEKEEELDHDEAVARMEAYGTSLSFRVRRRETVLSDSNFQKAVIATRRMTLDLEHIAVPLKSPNAFLRACLKHTGNTPLLPGKMNIFYNGTLINTSVLRFLNPSGTAEVPLGIDEMVRVKRENLAASSSSKGVFKKKTRKHLGYRIGITNFHAKPVKLKVLDQLPISEDKDIKVFPAAISPQPRKSEPKDAAKPDGLLEWNLQMKPGEKRNIQVKYDVVFPAGTPVHGRSEEPEENEDEEDDEEY